MAQIPVPNCLRSVARFTLGMEEAIVTMHMRKPTVYDDTVAEELAVRIMTFYTVAAPGGMGGLRPDESILQTVSIQDISTAPFPNPYVHNVVLGSGLATVNCLPLEVAVVISLRTDVATRAGRGRMYHPHISVAELQHVAGVPVFVSAVGMAVIVQEWFNDLAALGAPVVVASTRSEIDGVVQPAIARNVTSIKIDNLWDTQRRRAEGLIATATGVQPITIP